MKLGKWIILTTCFAAVTQASGWSDAKAIAEGKTLFANNCATCHGPEGIGPQSPALKAKRKDGKFQPPALNGTAHTWHHAPGLLKKIIAKGGNSYGKGYKGWMPEFEATLTAKERDAILVYLHALWPDKVRRIYDERFGIKGDSSGGLSWK